MKKALCIIGMGFGVMVTGAAMSLAHASVRPEVGVGVTNFTTMANGIWYQKGVPDNETHTHGRALMVGMTGHIVRGLDWHADYVNLGHARAACYCTTIDADYNLKTHALRPGTPMARYSGRQTTQGVKLSITQGITVGRWTFGAEAGAFVYRPDFTENVYAWHVADETPVDLTLHARRSVQVGRVFGGFVSRGRWTVSVERYHLGSLNGDAVPPFANGAALAMVTYQL